MSSIANMLTLIVQRPATPNRRVTDAATRMFHWLFALSFLGAYLTSDGERWRHIHITLGYTMIGLLAARLFWGLIGPKRSRLSALVQKAKAISPWLRQCRSASSWHTMNWQLPQQALTAMLVMVLLFATIPLVLSGYLTDIDFAGEFMEELHEWMGNFYLMTVLAHIGLLMIFSVLRRKNLASPMLSGYTAGAGPDLVKQNHVIVAFCLLACTLAWWVWSLALS